MMTFTTRSVCSYVYKKYKECNLIFDDSSLDTMMFGSSVHTAHLIESVCPFNKMGSEVGPFNEYRRINLSLHPVINCVPS